MVVLHTAIAIVLVIGLIIRLRVDPVISLVLGSLYLGLASGVGFTGTLEAITTGFGGIMAKVGLLIGFGVVIGSLLHATGAFKRMVSALVSAVGPKRLPYAMAGAMSTIFPSIYVDVQVVLASPVARSAAPHLGPNGLPLLAGAIGTGIFSGYVFVVPGLAVILIAGQVDVSLGAWLFWGLLIGLTTALVTTFLFQMLLRSGYWKPATDEDPDDAMQEVEAHDRRDRPRARRQGSEPAGLGRADHRPAADDRLRGIRGPRRCLQRLHRVHRQRQPGAVRRPARGLSAGAAFDRRGRAPASRSPRASVPAARSC